MTVVLDGAFGFCLIRLVKVPRRQGRRGGTAAARRNSRRRPQSSCGLPLSVMVKSSGLEPLYRLAALALGDDVHLHQARRGAQHGTVLREGQRPANTQSATRISPLSEGPQSHIQISDVEGVLLDELAAALDVLAHQRGEDLLALHQVLQADAQQRAGTRRSWWSPTTARRSSRQALVALHAHVARAFRLTYSSNSGQLPSFWRTASFTTTKGGWVKRANCRARVRIRRYSGCATSSRPTQRSAWSSRGRPPSRPSAPRPA